MAIRTVEAQDVDELPTVEEVRDRFGFDRDAADLYLTTQQGLGLIGDRARVPADQRDRILREQEEAATAYLASVEEAAKNIDPAATVEENMARTGLDRYATEIYLAIARGER